MPKLSEIKSWNPEIEEEITKKWSSKDLFPVSPKTKKKIYSIDTPPPYVNRPIHIAQAVTYCYMDFFARYKRMKGFDVIFPLGLDRNGLPIEMATEQKFKISPFKIGREKFLEYCKKLIDEGSEGTTESFSKLGISFTSYKEGNHLGSIYKTDSPEYRSLTQSTFIELYKKGIVYEDKRINNWDPKLQTTIADSEIEYKDVQSTFNNVSWKVKDSKEEIIIATTRPELICACGYVIFNPKDKRYQHLKNKKAIVPIYNREVPIIPDPMAQEDKGTGIMMVCGGGDLMDNQFFRNRGETPIIAIDKDGTMNEHAGFLKGLKVKEAREKIIEELKSSGLLKKQEQISHRTPISERSNAEIEFIEMQEFYLKQLDFIKDIKKISKQINFYPKDSRKILNDWLNSITIDWPISRRRFYATPIPLWHSGNLTALPKPGKYYTPWKESPPKNAEVFENHKSTNKTVKDFPDKKWEGETRVFDTWMDSSISELYILQYPSAFSKKAYPATLRPQGKEIVRTWLYYTLLRGYLETKKPAFKDVWVHQHLTDSKGRKMSKSLGNIIDPKDVIKEDGAEALRLWAATEGDLAKQDLKVSKEKIKAERKTLNKLLNISKFIQQFPKPTKVKLTKLDKTYIIYTNYMANKVDSDYSDYNFFKPAVKLRKFLWEKFASHYIELIKARAYNQEKIFSKEEQKSAHYTLHYLLEKLIILLHPIIPQITATIAEDLKINLSKFPATKKQNQKDLDKLYLVKTIEKFNSSIWKKKKNKRISLKEPIKGIKINSALKPFEKDLIACHNLEGS